MFDSNFYQLPKYHLCYEESQCVQNENAKNMVWNIMLNCVSNWNGWNTWNAHCKKVVQALQHFRIAQEKWSCGQPRPCLAYGLCFLVLPVVRSVRRPSSHDDVIQSSTWNHPDKDPFLYGRRHRHYDGRSISIIRHRKTLFRWIFRCVCHRNAVRWKYRIASTILVLNLRRLGGNFHLVCTGCTTVPWPTLGTVGVGQSPYKWYHGTQCRVGMIWLVLCLVPMTVGIGHVPYSRRN